MAELKRVFLEREKESVDRTLMDDYTKCLDYKELRDMLKDRMVERGINDVEKKMHILDKKHILDERTTSLVIQAAMFDEEYRKEHHKYKDMESTLKFLEKDYEEKKKLYGVNKETEALIENSRKELEEQKDKLKEINKAKRIADKNYLDTSYDYSRGKNLGFGDKDSIKKISSSLIQSCANCALIFLLAGPGLAALFAVGIVGGLTLMGLAEGFARHKTKQTKQAMEEYKNLMFDIYNPKTKEEEEELNKEVEKGQKEIKDNLEQVKIEDLSKRLLLEYHPDPEKEEVLGDLLSDEYQEQLLDIAAFIDEREKVNKGMKELKSEKSVIAVREYIDRQKNGMSEKESDEILKKRLEEINKEIAKERYDKINALEKNFKISDKIDELIVFERSKDKGSKDKNKSGDGLSL